MCSTVYKQRKVENVWNIQLQKSRQGKTDLRIRYLAKHRVAAEEQHWRKAVQCEWYQCAAELSTSPGQLSDGGVGSRQQRLLQAGQQGIQPATLSKKKNQNSHTDGHIQSWCFLLLSNDSVRNASEENKLTNWGTNSCSSNQLIRISNTISTVDWRDVRRNHETAEPVKEGTKHCSEAVTVTWLSLLTMLRKGGKPTLVHKKSFLVVEQVVKHSSRSLLKLQRN